MANLPILLAHEVKIKHKYWFFNYFALAFSPCSFVVFLFAIDLKKIKKKNEFEFRRLTQIDCNEKW